MLNLQKHSMQLTPRGHELLVNLIDLDHSIEVEGFDPELLSFTLDWIEQNPDAINIDDLVKRLRSYEIDYFPQGADVRDTEEFINRWRPVLEKVFQEGLATVSNKLNLHKKTADEAFGDVPLLPGETVFRVIPDYAKLDQLVTELLERDEIESGFLDIAALWDGEFDAYIPQPDVTPEVLAGAFEQMFNAFSEHGEIAPPTNLVNIAKWFIDHGFITNVDPVTEGSLPSFTGNQIAWWRTANKLNLCKQSWDNGNYNQEYHPGSNTAGPVDRTVPRAPRDLPRENQRTKEDYHTPSLLNREPEETGQGETNPTNKSDHPPNRPDDDPWGESNYLRPFKGLKPYENLPHEFNEDFDTEYYQRQFGNVHELKRRVLAVLVLYKMRELKYAKKFNKASLQTQNIPEKLIAEIKEVQKSIPKDKLYKGEDDKGWVENGLQQNFHITILFGVKDDVENGAKEIFKDYGDISISTSGKINYFDNDDFTVAIIKCVSSKLKKLHKKLKNEFENAHKKDFHPYVTIAYLQPGERLEKDKISSYDWDIKDFQISKSTGELKKIALNWDKLHTGPIKKEDIQPDSPAIKNKEWQEFRKSLKGLSNEEKYKKLEQWLKDHNNSERAKIQVTNYINALKRGGQVSAALAIPIRESLDYPHSWNKKEDKKKKDEKKNKKEASEIRKFDNKEYKKCSNMGLSGNIAAAFEVIKRDNEYWVPTDRYDELKKAMQDIKKDLKKGSILDKPRSELDPAIWLMPENPDDLPMLKPNVRIHIVTNFFDYISDFGGYKNPHLWVKNMFYTGSTATYTYHDKSDIDIHVIVDWEDMLKENPEKVRDNLEEIWRELHDTFWWTLNEKKLPGTKHPLTYYVIKPGNEKSVIEQKEEIYDIGHNVWLIPPGKTVNLTEDVIGPALEEADEFMERIDKHLSNARRDLIDYTLLQEYITHENAPAIYQRLAEKLNSIDKELKQLKEEYAVLKQKRQQAFETGDSLIEGSSNYSIGNIIFKLVERYKYMDTLRKIKRITDDIDLQHDQIPDIARVLLRKEE